MSAQEMPAADSGHLPDGWQYTPAGEPQVLVRDQGGTRFVYVWIDSKTYPDIEELRHIFRLTPTQARVAQMLVSRRTNAEIASLLGISIHTARRHVEAVLLRLGLQSRWDVERHVYETAARRAALNGSQSARDAARTNGDPSVAARAGGGHS